MEERGVDQVTEVTNTSWFARVGQAIVGVLIGLVAIVVSIGLLFWNEGRAIRTAQGLSEGAGSRHASRGVRGSRFAAARLRPGQAAGSERGPGQRPRNPGQ